MLTVRPSAARGHANHGWLDSRHTFSFAGYHDPAHMGVSCLRVINEDRVAPGAGFGAHSHRDMEIISYVLEGALEHRDSLGNRAVIRPGEVQRMSAGTGVTHSEYNASDSEPVHFLQIWIIPDRTGLAPGYQQREYPAAERRGRLRLVASPDGAEGSVGVHQDVRLYTTLLAGNETLVHPLAPGRTVYLHVARGGVEVNGVPLRAGDGATLRDEAELGLAANGVEAEVLVFDLP